MLVKLMRDWFGPDGHLYVRDARGTDIPDEIADSLPKSAVPLDPRVAQPKLPVPSLRDHDGERAAADAEAKALDEAEAARKANAERIRKALEAEKKGR